MVDLCKVKFIGFSRTGLGLVSRTHGGPLGSGRNGLMGAIFPTASRFCARLAIDETSCGRRPLFLVGFVGRGDDLLLDIAGDWFVVA